MGTNENAKLEWNVERWQNTKWQNFVNHRNENAEKYEWRRIIKWHADIELGGRWDTHWCNGIHEKLDLELQGKKAMIWRIAVPDNVL